MSTNRPPEAEDADDKPFDDPEFMELLRNAGMIPVWEDEANAPPVDHEELKRLAQKSEWTEATARVYGLTLKFRSWYDVFIQYLAIEAKRNEIQEPSPPQNG